MSDTAENVGAIIGEVVAGAAGVFVPVGVVQDIITLAAKYGIPAGIKVFNLWKKAATGEPVTVDEVEAAFGDLKPYEAYDIPERVPVVDTSAVPGVPVV